MKIEIEAGIDFERNQREIVTSILLNLPEPFRPTSFNWGEDEKPKLISDPGAVASRLLGKSYGFFLYAPGVTYDLTTGWERTIILRVYFETQPVDMGLFFRHLSAGSPLFGFACVEQERFARNQVKTSFGENKLESWVGRHPLASLPGLYWYTLISNRLLQKHGISLAPLVAMAKQYEQLTDEQHLFRFYDHPEDWKNAEQVNHFIAEQHGIFNVDEVKKRLPEARTFLEITSLLAKWP